MKRVAKSNLVGVRLTASKGNQINIFIDLYGNSWIYIYTKKQALSFLKWTKDAQAIVKANLDKIGKKGVR